MPEIQILNPKPIIFKTTFQAAAARCEICNHYTAIAYQPIINGQWVKDLKVCQKCLAIPSETYRAAIMATIYPKMPTRVRQKLSTGG